MLSLALVSQSLRVPNFGIIWSKTDGLIIVAMSFIDFLQRWHPVQISITSVEKDCSISRIKRDGIIEILFSLIQLFGVIISQASIIEQYTFAVIDVILDSFAIMSDGIIIPC